MTAGTSQFVMTAVVFFSCLCVGRLLWHLTCWWVSRPSEHAVPLRPLVISPLETGRWATVDQLVDAARAAALRIEPIAEGFEVFEQPWVSKTMSLGVRVRAREGNTTLSNLEISYDFYTNVFPLANALVPLFGPFRIELDGERILIDGNKHAQLLVSEHAKRLRTRALAEHRPG